MLNMVYVGRGVLGKFGNTNMHWEHSGKRVLQREGGVVFLPISSFRSYYS